MNNASATNPAYNLSNNINQLLSELSKDFDRRRLEKCHQRGYTDIRLSHFSLFSNLGYGTARLTELAEQAKITQQAMGKVVKEMERSGYISRREDSSDKRAKIIQLTTKGQKLVDDSVQIVDEIIDEYTKKMGKDGIRELEKALHQSVNAIRK
jgi:DNA-binding MarR family transcriptional regulator